MQPCTRVMSETYARSITRPIPEEFGWFPSFKSADGHARTPFSLPHRRSFWRRKTKMRPSPSEVISRREFRGEKRVPSRALHANGNNKSSESTDGSVLIIIQVFPHWTVSSIISSSVARKRYSPRALYISLSLFLPITNIPYNKCAKCRSIDTIESYRSNIK